MADGFTTGAPQELKDLIAQFVDAEYVNRQIDGMFKPVVTRMQTDMGKKDFTLFSLFFGKNDVQDIKKHITTNLTKLFNNIKTDKMFDVDKNGRKVTGTSKGDAIIKVAPKKEGKSTSEVFDEHKILNVNIAGISPDVLKLLKVKPTEIKENAAPTAPKGDTSFLEKLIGAALAGFAGFKFLAGAWSKEGPFRGTLEAIGQGLIALVSRFVMTGVTALGKILTSGGLSKVLGKFGAGGLAKLAGKAGEFLLKKVRFIPFIGPLISFGFAIKRMMDGDYAGGIVELIGGLVGLVPIPGLSIIGPIVADLFLAYGDYKGITGSKGSATTWIKDFGQALIDTGPIRWLRNIGDAIGKIISGDFAGGITDLGNTLYEVPGMKWIAGLFGAKPDENGKIISAGDTNIIEMIQNEIMDKINDVLKFGKKALNKVRKFFGLDSKEEPKDDANLTESQKGAATRSKLADIKEQENKEKDKHYFSDDTKNKKLSELAAQRSTLERQVEEMDKKYRKNKPVATPVATNIDAKAEEDRVSEEAVKVDVVPIAKTDTVSQVRQTANQPIKTEDHSQKIVAAIEDLKFAQIARDSKKEERESGPTSYVSNVTNTVKPPATDVNVDTSRDSVFITRNAMRYYLYNQRQPI